MNKEQIKNEYNRIGEFWNKQEKQQLLDRTRWWQSQHIIEHYNFRVCGKKLSGWNAGPIELLKQYSNNRVFKKGLSIGCGIGNKEMTLLERGIVDTFVCYELSQERINKGQELAKKRGLSERIYFFLDDFFSSNHNCPETFDLVFWDNSLHHMLDTKEAINISKNVLVRGGWFFCNDFVGKNRFQWSDVEVALMNGIRLNLPEEIYEVNGKKISRFITRPNINKMIETDPSEAADSESIIKSIHGVFDSPLIINTGGVIYHTCLNDILKNIPERSELLEWLLNIDDEIADHGYTQYAFALAQK